MDKADAHIHELAKSKKLVILNRRSRDRAIRALTTIHQVVQIFKPDQLSDVNFSEFFQDSVRNSPATFIEDIDQVSSDTADLIVQLSSRAESPTTIWATADRFDKVDPRVKQHFICEFC